MLVLFVWASAVECMSCRMAMVFGDFFGNGSLCTFLRPRSLETCKQFLPEAVEYEYHACPEEEREVGISLCFYEFAVPRDENAEEHKKPAGEVHGTDSHGWVYKKLLFLVNSGKGYSAALWHVGRICAVESCHSAICDSESFTR